MNDSPTFGEESREGQDLRALIRSHSVEDLKRAASDPRLTEDLALSLLQRRDLPSEALEAIGKNGELVKHRRVLLALAAHVKTPRHVSLPIMRHLYSFELMQIALTSNVLAEIKRAAEDGIVPRLEQTSLGERLSMARRASGRVAAALLLDPEPRVIEAALDNPFLTEALVVRSLKHQKALPPLVEILCRHSDWCHRRDIQIALLQNENTPTERVSEYAKGLSTGLLREVLAESAVPEKTRNCMKAELELRSQKKTV